MVVVVVPAFAKRDQRQEKVVARIIFRLKIATSPNMRKRVDGVCAVVAQHSGDKEAPNQSLGGSQPKARKECCSEVSCTQHKESSGNCWDVMISIQPDQLWELHPIFYQPYSYRGRFFAKEPSAMRLPKAVLLGGVGVQMGVGM